MKKSVAHQLIVRAFCVITLLTQKSRVAQLMKKKTKVNLLQFFSALIKSVFIFPLKMKKVFLYSVVTPLIAIDASSRNRDAIVPTI